MNPTVYLLDYALHVFEVWPAPSVPIHLAVQWAGRIGLDKPDWVRKLQWLRLRRTIRYASERSPFYRDRLAALGVKPKDITSQKDFIHLPLTTVQDLLDWYKFLAVPEDHLSAVFTTSGTTGEPKRVYYTARELNALSNVGAFGLRLRLPGRITALIALPYGLWIGTFEATRVVERAGGLNLPVGSSEPSFVVGQMRRFRPNVVITSPSFMVALTREAEQQQFRSRLDAILVGGETLTQAHKDRFLDYWSAPTYNSYGSTEIGGGQSMALPMCECLHLNDLQLYTEIIDPATGLPAEEGELVFTPLVREAMPLLRYRSGDLARWSNCNCWLPFGSIHLIGRTDNMFVAGDMNLYGHLLAEAAGKAPGASGRVTIWVDKVDLTDRIRLKVEGSNVLESDVRNHLYDIYPELPHNLAVGNLLLDIEVNVRLNDQFKAVKMIDLRGIHDSCPMGGSAKNSAPVRSGRP